ncbi:MAG: DUF3782 domain-containing protein [Akkermansiaceae bacterium]|nr:DUF3782 domain-containing protein [Akkermansiaceae bacterium]
MAKAQRETDKQLKELGKQIGGLGNKFGTFTEGMSYRPLEKILAKEFKMNEFIAPQVTVRRGQKVEEYDILAYSNGSIDKGMIVEIKSTLRKEDIIQMKRKMEEIFDWLPDHKDKTFYGVVACVSGSQELKKEIMKNGWYLAHIGDDLFELETPKTFKAKDYKAVS